MINTYLKLALSFFTLLLIPGPAFTLITRNALLYSRKSAFLSAAGILAGSVIQILFIFLLLSAFNEKSVPILILKFLCPFYIIYLGCMSIKGNVKSNLDGLRKKDYFSQGFLLEILNPLVLIFLISTFSNHVNLCSATVAQKISYLLEWLFLSTFWFYLLCVVFSNNFFVNKVEKNKRRIEIFSGIIFISFGFKFIWDALYV